MGMGKTLQESKALYDFGEEIGLSLQMYDDLSGVTNSKRYHKAHEDFFRLRPTWIWLWLARNEDVDTIDYYALVEELESINSLLSQDSNLNLNSSKTIKAYTKFRA